jgi:hypothetical protein
MRRKRIADKAPAISKEGAAVAPQKLPATGNAPDSNKARAPRASANAVTHRHKTPTIETQTPAPVPAEEIVVAAPKPAALVETPSPVQPPSQEQIAIRAYLLAESRGFQGGSTEDDWFNAERQLRAERFGK